MGHLKIGKLDSEILQRIVLDKIRLKREEVITKAGVGEDCAVIDFGKYECSISTDPITADVSNIGRLAINISCNDVASNGIEPLGITLAVMLPVNTRESEVEKIMEQAAETAKEVGVEIIGGHTEVTPAVNQPVIVSTAFGKGLKGTAANIRNMKPGNKIIMTKMAGMEGIGIIAANKDHELKDILTSEELIDAKKMINNISVVKEGIIAGRIGTCGMHDVTEGGILGGIWEMCHLSNLGAKVDLEKIPVDYVTKKITSYYGINPLRLISSGCMIIIAEEEKTMEIIESLQQDDISIKASIIGEIKERSFGIKQVDGNSNVEDIIPPYSDELYKVI